LSIVVANAPVSWGIYEARDRVPGPAEVLDAIAAAGYAGTELGPYGYLSTDADELARQLDARALALGSSFVALPLEDASAREGSIAQALDVARLLHSRGVRELILADDEDPSRAAIAGRIPDDGSAGWSDAQWDVATGTIDAIARALAEELDMRVVLHHHAGTFLETPREIERVLAATDAARVGLLLDTGHCVYGGGDANAVFERHKERVWYVHLKDARKEEIERVRTTDVSMQEAWRRGVFCPLGEGVVDFGQLARQLAAADYSGWLVVEQDVVPDEDGRLVPDPIEAAKQSRAFVRETFGA
jgi:inosose dehydratase